MKAILGALAISGLLSLYIGGYFWFGPAREMPYYEPNPASPLGSLAGWRMDPARSRSFPYYWMVQAYHPARIMEELITREQVRLDVKSKYPPVVG